jgi:hypothetical protein
MDHHRISPEVYRRTVLAYHGLPVVIAFALVGAFFAVFLFTSSFAWSSLAAAAPSGFLAWRWVLAGRQIDRWGCPKCGGSFPRKTYSGSPPKACTRCRARLGE